MSSCNNTGCTENRSSLLLAGFYGSDGKAVTIKDMQLGGVGAPNDSLLLQGTAGAREVYLPLRSNATTTAFFTHYMQEGIDAPEWNDTITLGYTSIPYLASEECGVVYHYQLDRVVYTRHIIDSVGIVDSLVDNRQLQRMKIYFKTAADDK